MSKNKSQIKISKSALYITIFIVILLLVFFGGFGIIKMAENAGKVDVLSLEEKFVSIESGNLEDYGFLYGGGVPFVEHDGLWYSRFLYNDNLVMLALHYPPDDVMVVPMGGSIFPSFFQKQDVYVTFNPLGEDMNYTALSAAELSLSLVKSFQGKPIAACAKNQTETCSVRPIVTCDDENKSVIYLNNSAGEEKITFDGNCISIEGTGTGLLRATEKLIYTWYGFDS